MAVTFEWNNYLQSRGENVVRPWQKGTRQEKEFALHLLKSYINKVFYLNDPVTPQTSISFDVVVHTPEKMEERLIAFIQALEDITGRRDVVLENTHWDTCQVTLENVTRDNVKAIVSHLCEQAWLHNDVLVQMQASFQNYDREGSGPRKRRPEGPSRG